MIALRARILFPMAAVVGCLGCAGAPPATSSIAPNDVRAILAAAGDSVIGVGEPSRSSQKVVYGADSLTLLALGPAAHRVGITLAPAPSQVWCGDPEQTGRAVGIVYALRLNSLARDRAEVAWSWRCLFTPGRESKPASGGEFGVWELVWEQGRWRVSRSLAHFAS